MHISNRKSTFII